MTEYFLGDPATAVERSLAGFTAANPRHCTLERGPLFVRGSLRNPSRRVGLISGGGSGHEPLHAGFVGSGMLDAVAPGKVFASPHNRQIYEASRAVAGEGGVLHIVKNYTGDRINFGIAAERLQSNGIAVARVLVDDDVATESETTATGRRGTGGALIVEKILGAAADTGLSLERLQKLGAAVAASTRSIAVASESLTSMHNGLKTFELEKNQLEYGVGIHGERAQHTSDRPEFSALLHRMLGDLRSSLELESGAQVILLVNGLGAATNLELYAIFDEVRNQLAAADITVAGNLVGTYVSALDMRGFSLSMLRVDDPAWIAFWEAPVDTPAWRSA